VTGAVDSDVLKSSLYVMKACPVKYTGFRQLRFFTTPIRLLIDPYYNTPATTSLLTHPYISRCNFIPHPSLHILLQLQLLPYFRKQLCNCSCPSQMHALTPAQIPLYRGFFVSVHVFIFFHPHF
jgi:hypothetical protein